MTTKHVAAISTCICIYQTVHFLVSQLNSCTEYSKVDEGFIESRRGQKLTKDFSSITKIKTNKVHSTPVPVAARLLRS